MVLALLKFMNPSLQYVIKFELFNHKQVNRHSFYELGINRRRSYISQIICHTDVYRMTIDRKYYTCI